jgi:hypothetical protein
MPIEGIPIPLAIIVTGLPLYMPVYPFIPLTELTSLGFSRNVSAIYLALNGSPGIRTVFAKSSGVALI